MNKFYLLNFKILACSSFSVANWWRFFSSFLANTALSRWITLLRLISYLISSQFPKINFEQTTKGNVWWKQLAYYKPFSFKSTIYNIYPNMLIQTHWDDCMASASRPPVGHLSPPQCRRCRQPGSPSTSHTGLILYPLFCLTHCCGLDCKLSIVQGGIMDLIKQSNQSLPVGMRSDQSEEKLLSLS